MSPRISVLLIAAALAACGGEELRAPLAGAPSRFGTYGNEPAPRGLVASRPSPPKFALEATPVAEVGDLCTYRARKDPVMQGFVDRTGTQWEGEIHVRDLPSLDPKWFSPSDKRMATMVARPRVEVFRVRVDDNCYDAATKTYRACTKVLEADVSQVRGFARALDLDRARNLAVLLCEKKVAEIVDKSTQLRQENIDLRCHVYEQAFCELPPAPPAPAKKK